MAKSMFTTERSRQFDILQVKEATFQSVDGCSERASELSMPGYQLKPSDRSKLNWSIKKLRGMVEKLNVTMKDLKEHGSTLFQSNGLALRWLKTFSSTFQHVDFDGSLLQLFIT